MRGEELCRRGEHRRRWRGQRKAQVSGECGGESGKRDLAAWDDGGMAMSAVD